MIKKEKREAMLYFIYNKEIVSVLVAHNISEGEFVLQVPYPYTDHLSEFTPAHCIQMIQNTTSVHLPDVQIQQLGNWDMSAIVFSHLSNPSA